MMATVTGQTRQHGGKWEAHMTLGQRGPTHVGQLAVLDMLAHQQPMRMYTAIVAEALQGTCQDRHAFCCLCASTGFI